MGIQKVLQLFSGYRKNEAAQRLDQNGATEVFKLPNLELAPDMAFIAAKGEATHRGTIGMAQGEREVDAHHESLAKSYLEQLSEHPKGLQQSKKKDLKYAIKDIDRVEKELSKLNKRHEVNVPSARLRSTAEQVKLVCTGVAATALSVWSVYSIHAFLSGSGTLSGWPAWGVSFGPILFAFAAKEALTTIKGDDQRRMLRLAFISTTIVAAIAWIATFAHESGGGAAQLLGQLNTPNTTVSPTDDANKTVFMVRGIAQLLIEIFGGAILFYTLFELWGRKEEGQDYHKEVHESPHYLAAEKELQELRKNENELETQVGQIDKWFESHSPFTAQYMTRAKGQYTHVINVLKGLSS